DEVAFLRIRGAATCATKLREHAEQARLFRRLTRIALDAPGASTVEVLLRRRQQPDQLDRLCEQLRFGAFTRSRLRALLR
ncbi:MAG TPA: exodeoxyribonuclease IX, partial [Rhodanobacter sp.]|nr:exodeoxyribonuclease IX [Rhodanobacter sp.]